MKTLSLQLDLHRMNQELIPTNNQAALIQELFQLFQWSCPELHQLMHQLAAVTYGCKTAE